MTGGVKTGGAAWGSGEPSAAQLLKSGAAAKADQANVVITQLVDLACKAQNELKGGGTPGALKHTRETFVFIEMEAPTLANIGTWYGTELVKVSERLAVVEKDRDAATAAAAAQISMQRVLVGELAVTLDQVVVEFMVGLTSTRAWTISGLHKAYLRNQGELTVEQRQRWEIVEPFITRHWGSVWRLCANSKALKDLRRADAHLTAAVKEAVSAQMLRQYAATTGAPAWVEEFIEVLALFGVPDEKGAPRPLVPKSDVSAVWAM